MASSKNLEEQKVPFLQHSDDLQSSNQVLQYTDTTNNTNHGDDYDGKLNTLVERVRLESSKLWHIVGPAIISRITGYGMLIATQAFAGHLGDLELAAFAIGINVICGLDYGFLLGMASALETLCGQAFGAKRPYMLGVYLQRSWVVLFLCCILLLPLYIFATPMLKLLGQPDDVAELAGVVARWMLPFHFSLAFQFPLQRFLQCQLKTRVVACVSVIALLVHLFVSWLFVSVLKFGIIGVAITLNCGWWVMVIGLFGYTALGGCPHTWTGFSMEAFSGLWEFFKLSISSGVMLCLENWYYKVLILMTGNLKNAKIALDALSIWFCCVPLMKRFKEEAINGEVEEEGDEEAINEDGNLLFQVTKTARPPKFQAFKRKTMNISSWEMMIPLAFFVGVGVRVANELGAGNGKGAKFATKVAVITSVAIGLFFWILVLFFHENIAYIFSTSPPVIEEVKKLSILLAFTILLNSVQPVLSGVAVGSGWQSTVAYINLGCYYLLGVPLGILLGWKYNQGVMGMWAGMIFGGTAVQTVILAIITMRCDWEKEAQRASMNVKKWAERI